MSNRHSVVLSSLIFVIVVISLFTAVTCLAQTSRVPDCIISSAGSCRGQGIRQVSAINMANQVTINAPNIARSLAIHMACSAGTAAVTVSVSADGQANFLTLDTLTAAATVVKFYDTSTVGAAIALPPGAFQYIRVSAATCGAGNTSTLTVSIKGL